MRGFQLMTLLLSGVLAAGLCTVAVSAESSSVTHTGSASIEFRRKTTPPWGGGSGGSGSAGGSSIRDTDPMKIEVIQDSTPPMSTVTILDKEQPLGLLPKTGGDALMPTVIILLGAGCLVAAKYSALDEKRQRGSTA